MARRALGQHFLLDLNLTARIARAARPLAGVHVIEVGPGPGGLTRALLATEASEVIAVEKDPRCVAALADLAAASAGRLHVLPADALDLDVTTLCGTPRAIVANLPFNVATPLLIGWLRQAQAFERLVLMFQREVADRLSAAPGSKAYGRLSVLAQWRAKVDRLFTVPARAFTPSPKVDSAVVLMEPHESPLEADWTAMQQVTAAAFGQRRKMLRQSLKVLPHAEALMAEAGLAPTDRAEDVDIAGFASLARALDGRRRQDLDEKPPAGPR